jgi:phenylpropionate dioxygenase-like ring-hydroxylating dioxygenase large terminal subunit
MSTVSNFTGRSTDERAVRDDFVPKEGYLSRDFARLEAERMWPRTWQVACRLEEIPRTGDFVTYDILDESIIVVRSAAGQIKAFYNVCQHRGRRLTEGCGHVKTFMCRFHGWTWKLDGSLAKVLDHEDWAECSQMAKEDLRLNELKVETWGGFVFVTMDPEAEPLAKYLAPMPSYIDCFELDKMRYRWFKSVRLPCNWKVALEAFNEGYHVAATHTQLLDMQGDDVTRSFAMGKHAMFGYPTSTRPLGAPSSRTGKPMPADVRPGLLRFFKEMEDTLKAIFTERDYEALQARLMQEIPADAEPMEVFVKALQIQKEAAIDSGAGWPDLSLEQLARAGTDWHIFPNLIFLMWPDGALAYRARPDAEDPNFCFFDIWSLARYAPGKEPPLQREYFYGADDWRTEVVQRFGLVLSQDFQNMGEVQKGMKSRGFRGSRTSPLQETTVSNFHRVLYRYISQDL